MTLKTTVKFKSAVKTILEMVRNGSQWEIDDKGSVLKVVDNTSTETMKRNSYKIIVTGDNTFSVIRFADLHRHSDNSLLDGMSHIGDMVEATEYAGALTDHGVMYGFLDFYKKMKKAGKKPIIGYEAYSSDMEGNLTRNHLILLAKNNTGYKNLVHLCSKAYEHFYKKPHVTFELLREHKEGIIATSACLGGLIQRCIADGRFEDAETALLEYLDIFGEDFYIEIQRHGIDEEFKVNSYLLELAKKHNVKVVATTDSHYVKKEDAPIHEMLLCMQTQATLATPHYSLSGSGYHIHSSEEMEALFSDCPEVLDNSLEVADKCDVEISLGEINMPHYEVPLPFKNTVEYFRHLCDVGFESRFKDTNKINDKTYIDRFEYELSVILNMGFADYFVIVWDYINFARTNDIYVGPGRGSAAGSLVAYCLGITDLDPIELNLLFERFLNPERVSMPDIDTDFEHTRRGEVIDYIHEKYGEENVCRIVTFITLGPKKAVRDIAKVMGLSPQIGSSIAGLIPKKPGITLQQALSSTPELCDMYEKDPTTKAVIDASLAIEGTKRNSSQHACGLIISPTAVTDWLPTSMEKNPITEEKDITAQVTMTECEDLSLLKMDLLGLVNMTVIHDVHDSIIDQYGIDTILKQIKIDQLPKYRNGKRKTFDYQDIPLTNRDTYRLLAQGWTGGVFQLESPGMTKVITKMLADIESLPEEELGQCFERLIAAVALYRPGPMESIPDYLKGMRDQSSVYYEHPLLEPILSPTYGVVVYQEQVIQIVRSLGGFTGGRADEVRRAMGKKKLDVMEHEKNVFIYGNKEAYEAGTDSNFAPGCIANGISEEVASRIWGKMADFAKYAFNRSHAACYAYIAYLTAYMSCHWPEHFYASMLNAFVTDSDKSNTYLSQVHQRDIKILPPCINKSKTGFSPDYSTGGVRFGLTGIATIKAFGPIITSAREANPFRDIDDLIVRVGLSGKNLGESKLKALVKAGALDCFGETRRTLMNALPDLVKYHKKNKNKMNTEQISLFENLPCGPQYRVLEETDKDTLLKNEFESLGVYLSGHPVNEALPRLKRQKFNPITLDALISTVEYDNSAYIFGLATNIETIPTKKGDTMLRFVVESQFQRLNCVVFPKQLGGCSMNIIDQNVIGIKGTYSYSEDFGAQIIVDSIVSQDSLLSPYTEGLCVVVNSPKEQAEVLALADKFHGTTKLFLRASNSDKVYPTKKSISMGVASIDALTPYGISTYMY